jgi:hypothetical protein
VRAMRELLADPAHLTAPARLRQPPEDGA